ncbi:MAG: hypothetical protein ABW178_10585 [Pseudoxanthomonas sp.]
MGLLRMVALGATAAVAYKLWKQKQGSPVTTSPAKSLHDSGDVTPPHGDPLLAVVEAEDAPLASVSQSSRGFGSPD